VWGASWEAAKTQAECYHYLFDAAVRMRAIGCDPSLTPVPAARGIGAETSYGTALAGSGGKRARVEGAGAGAGAVEQHMHADGCCGSGEAGAAGPPAQEGFGGAAAVLASAAAAAPGAASGPPANACADPSDVDAVLLDIEGTTTSIAFVTETLFPFAAAHLREHLLMQWGAPEAVSDVVALVAQSEADVAGGLPGAAAVALSRAHAAAFALAPAACAPALRAETLAALEAHIGAAMAANRKTGALKALQGHIWRAGYRSGALRAHVYPDTPAALAAWVAAGIKVYIYSSGSREAQRLLFAHSLAGDLRPHLSGYFDTSVGAKAQSSSYADIALSLGVDAPRRVLFATDAIAEARAAAEAGMVVAITDRPGNVPLPEGHGFRVVRTLTELLPRGREGAAGSRV